MDFVGSIPSFLDVYVQVIEQTWINFLVNARNLSVVVYRSMEISLVIEAFQRNEDTMFLLPKSSNSKRISTKFPLYES